MHREILQMDIAVIVFKKGHFSTAYKKAPRIPSDSTRSWNHGSLKERNTTLAYLCSIIKERTLSCEISGEMKEGKRKKIQLEKDQERKPISISLCMQLIKIHALARAASRRNSLYLRILPDSIPCHRHQPLDSIQLLPNGCPNRPSASLQQTLTLQHVCHYRKHRNPCQS
ncbi:hypothetical protein P5673_008133 [Acropora cervicornis]|uniref:Uncharacterized protein n=1 Tax=Acropora cervicornis TaxID=6130 RepID=A0AAD9QTY3_ACRCE|nr:hypothetical protein P5673_008133 [Acropora cervicornis]